MQKGQGNALLAATRKQISINYFRTRGFLSWPAAMPPLKPIEVQPKAFWRVHVDILGPLEMSRNGNKYVAVGVCALLKYVEAMRNYFYKLKLI